MRVSIIIPIYNTETDLVRCIESALSQTYNNLEIILVDDGSSDSSPQICDSYATKYDRVNVIHQSNCGSVLSRLNGVEISSGEYVVFMDSDDWIEPNAIEILVNGIEETNADIITGSYITDISLNVSKEFELSEKHIMNSQKALEEMFEQRFFNWAMHNKIYKKELFEGLSLVELKDSCYGDDTYINYRVFRRANIISYLPTKAYHYVCRAGSLMQKAISKRHYSYIKEWADIYIDCKNRGDGNIASIVLRIVEDSGWPIIKMGLDEFGRDDNETHNLLELVYDVFMKDLNNNYIKQIVKWNRMTTKDLEKYLLRRRTELKESLNGIENVYLYGAGKIGEEVAQLLEEEGISYKVVVSEQNESIFRGRIIRCFDSKSINNKDLIILGLNAENKAQIVEKIQGMNVIDLGRYSYYY